MMWDALPPIQRVNRIFSNLQRAILLVFQSSPQWTGISLFLLVIQGLLPLLSLYLMKLLIDSLTTGITTNHPNETLQQVVLWVSLAGIVTLLSDGCRALATLAQSAQTEAVTDRIHALIHAKSIQVDLDYYENTEYYNTLHRAQRQAAYRPPLILTGLIQASQSSLSLISILVLLTALHWSISILLVLAAIPAMLVRLKFTGNIYWRIRDWTVPERQADYFHTLLTEATHAKEIRLFNLGSLFSRRFQRLRQHLRRQKQTLALQSATIELITQSSATVAVFLACGMIAYQVVGGTITIGAFVMYYQAFQRGQSFLREVMSNVASLHENSLFLQDFYDFLDLQPSITAPAIPRPVPHPWKSGICFHSVTFDYPNSARTVLQDINLTLHAGEVVAIVGENGAGKTTLIKLLARLYDPTAGSITLDGINLRDFDPVELQRSISVLFQDYNQYQLTAQENIWLGNIDLSPDDPQIFTAAHKAGADTVIRQLPHAYNTSLGKWVHDGEELSLGQWQKIALARSFVRDAQLIVLDEPTSALDPKAEAEVFTAFRHLIQGRTAIVISHRLSTIKMVDRIFVLSAGRIVETGSHDELMQRNGLYAQLYETQAQHYRT